MKVMRMRSSRAVSRAMSATAFATVLTLFGALAAQAAPTPKPPCGTSGALGFSGPSPASYSYVLGDAGSVNGTVTVTSPSVNDNPSCDSTLAHVFGNGNGHDPSTLPVTISFGSIIDVTTSLAVSSTIEDAIKATFGSTPFSPNPANLTNPGSGSQTVDFTFTNSNSIPAGVYDVEITATPESGTGVGSPNPLVFTLTVTEPAIEDTLAPTVTIVTPQSGDRVCLDGNVSVNFTAIDPLEGGAGTGITAVGATIQSSGGAVSNDISNQLSVSPNLPQPADVTVAATANVPMNDIGSFTLTATAEDGAAREGSAALGFNVAVNVSPLPPISVQGRQFNVGSTVPIKLKLTDCNGLYLPPFPSIKIVVSGAAPEDTRVAGDGAANIRWELDEAGNATQYITNYQVPNVGQYVVHVFVEDVDGNPVEQGSFTFQGASKGGKS